MLAKVTSAATVGLSSLLVTVEVDISAKSLPSFSIVGLPSKSVEESKERVRAAIKNSGAEFPPYRIVVNLAPADLPKDGPAYDLPMAIGILIASGQLNSKDDMSLFYGELSLDGTVRHTNGILPITLLAKEKKLKRIFIPEINAKEAAVISGIDIIPSASLLSLYHHLTGSKSIAPYPLISFSSLTKEASAEFDFSDIHGQEQAKRALEIAASGGHNISMMGVPGAGKTMLARAFSGILPDLTEEEAIEVTKIYSVTGNLPVGSSVITVRPFRAPHHTTSRIGLIGGGARPIPGEISLAHRGVLFLDEFAEFPRHVLEAMRQPIEDGIVTISRASGSITYPAKFMLVVASNPCPCGYFGDSTHVCKCLPGTIAAYRKKISGPMVDRIDLHITLTAVKLDKLTGEHTAETSKKIRGRVQKARDIQTKRFQRTHLSCNADMNTKDVKTYCKLDSESLAILSQATQSMNLSARSYYRILKVARTIADLSGSADINQSHIAESLQYRFRDK